MKIAISTQNNKVCPHFGHAPQFTFVEIENNGVVNKEVLPNPGHTVGSIPQFVNDQGAKCMITGGMGRRAVQFFQQYGIETIMGIDGPVEGVIAQILDGTLEGGESICNPGAGKGFGVEKIHTEADDDNKDHHH